jgi:putative addiction module component (TIGR02574 family)
MTEIGLRLKDELLQLPAEDRVELGNILLDSVDGPNGFIDEKESAWIDELNRRLDDLKAGRAKAEPAREAIEELRQEALREQRRP